MKKRLPLILTCSLLAFSSVAVRANESPTPDGYTQAVTREVLSEGHPSQAAGQVLELVRYVVAPNTTLPTHIHPGMQIVSIEEGTLTYTVVEGTATVTRADGTTVQVDAGETLDLVAGDSLVEPVGMVHFGVNQTDNPIVLLSASLLDEHQPKAILLTSSPSNPNGYAR